MEFLASIGDASTQTIWKLSPKKKIHIAAIIGHKNSMSSVTHSRGQKLIARKVMNTLWKIQRIDAQMVPGDASNVTEITPMRVIGG